MCKFEGRTLPAKSRNLSATLRLLTPSGLQFRFASASIVASLMRKSKEVPITVLAALALFTTACQDAETRNCVDAQGHIAPDANCQTATPGVPYHFVYGGSSGGHIGDTVYGGSTTPSSGVSRGGFGGGGDDGGGE